MLNRTIVAALVISSDNQVLFGKKSPTHGGVYLDKWHIPGGGVEEGESQAAALVRELKEETALNISEKDAEPFDEIGSMVTLKTLASGEKVTCQMKFYIYKVQLKESASELAAEAGDDFEALKWIPLNDLAKYSHTPPSISLFLRHGLFTESQALAQRTFRDANEEVVQYQQTPLQWRVSAYALVVRGQEILIIKDKKEKFYDVVGGGVEFGETIEDAVYREALEEAGATVRIGKLVHTKVDWFYHNKLKQFYQTFQLFYSAQLDGELQQPLEDEAEWIGFVPLSEIGKKYQLPVTVQLAISQL